MNKENCALKLVHEINLYYDARSKKHEIAITAVTTTIAITAVTTTIAITAVTTITAITAVTS